MLRSLVGGPAHLVVNDGGGGETSFWEMAVTGLRRLARSADGRTLLNLGCGGVYSPEWNNVDQRPANASIQRCDLSRPLPFSDNAFDVVYSAHFLEHLPPDVGLKFLRECHRVLKDGGILRVVVPDLEYNARLYLDCLARASNEKSTSSDEARYLYGLLNLMDQAQRVIPGGELGRFLEASVSDDDWKFVVDTTGGIEAETVQASARGRATRQPAFFSRISRIVKKPNEALHAAAERWLVKAFEWVAGERYAHLLALMTSGEMHKAAYDRHSLGSALRSAGFERVIVLGPRDSSVDGWSRFRLDVTAEGKIRKPNSLFVEAKK